MDPNTCLIFGSYTGEPGAAERLNRTVWHLVRELGLRHFIAGPDDEFDWLAAQAVVRLKPLHKDLTLLRLNPAACWDTPLPRYFDGELFPDMRPQRGRLHNRAKAARTILPQVGHLILYEPFPHSWKCGVVTDARRLAGKGRLTLWDISFPD